MMTCLTEVFCTKLNFSFVFGLIKVLADFHDGIKDVSFAINFDSFLILLCLSKELSSLFPLPSISEILSLFHQNDGIALISMLLNQIIGFLELFESCVKVDGLLNKVILDKV
jgi:hypothetical protein